VEPDSQARLLRDLSKGRDFLRKLRLKAGAVWISLAIIATAIYPWLYPRQTLSERIGTSLFDPGDLSLFVYLTANELFFDLRLLLLSLAPFANDVLLTRAALIIDSLTFAVTRANCLSYLIAGAFCKLDMLHKVPYVSYLFRGAVFICLAIRALVQRSPNRVQSRMWDAIMGYLVLNMSEVFFDLLYHLVVFGAMTSRWGQVVVNLVAMWFVRQEGIRKRAQAAVRRWGQQRGAAVMAGGIASFLGGLEPRKAVELAKARFHAICLEDLSPGDVADNLPDRALYALTRPVRLGGCDAFVSHSWHDDSDAKWQALQAFRNGFVAKHEREPLIWFDKCCIDQNNIEDDLRCLPVFVSGCKSMVILCGTSYLSRLWCIVELMTWMQIHGSIENVTLLNVLRYGREDEDFMDILGSFQSFDARSCECFKKDDKERLMVIIETAWGTIESFNAAIAGVVGSLRSRSVRARCASGSDSGLSPGMPSSSAATFE